MKRLLANFGQPWWKLAVQQPKFGSRPYRFDSGPSLTHGLWCRLHSTWLGSWLYWCAHISSVSVPGRALQASFSSRSPNAGSPVIASARSSENMYSTTVQSSEPCDGSRPDRCSSQENMPLGRPWYLSSSAIICVAALRSASDPETSDQTGPVFTAWPLLTPCVVSARSLSPPPSFSLMNSAVIFCLYWKFAYWAIQS